MITAPRAATLGCLCLAAAAVVIFVTIGADFRHAVEVFLAQHTGGSG